MRSSFFNTIDTWNDAVRSAPDRPAIVDGDRRLTYAEADAHANERAESLSGDGIEHPKIAAFLPNCLEYYILYWAVMKLEGTIIPLNTWLKARELEAIMSNTEPDILVVKSARDEVLKATHDKKPQKIVMLTGGASDPISTETGAGVLPAPCTSPGGSRASLTKNAGTCGVPAIVMHTSGTTGVPKGAVMRDSDIAFNVSKAIEAHGFCDTDVHLVTSPMFHCGPFYTSLPTAAYTRTPIVLASPSRPEELMATIERERVTTFMSSPAVFQQLLKVPELDNYNCSSLRLLAYAGSPMPKKTIEQLRSAFPGVALHNFFGLTETISMTHVLRDDEAEVRPDSIGRLLSSVKAIVVDEELKEVPPGDTGELLFARENVVSAYYNQPGRLEESVVETGGRKWFRTGDFAGVDEDGYFFIRGRKKDMIIVGGENVYADEVEDFLISHARVSDAAVKGEPATGARSFLGEQVVAFVVPADDTVTERELRQYCFEGLPSYKVPGRVVFMDSLPRNPAGKVLKGML